jgi:hypothetical protein
MPTLSNMNANPVEYECQPCRALIWETRMVCDDVRRNAWDVLIDPALRAPGNYNLGNSPGMGDAMR